MLLYWLCLCSLGVFALIANGYGLFSLILRGDITYISFIIIGLFLWCFARVGVDILRGNGVANEPVYERWAGRFSALGLLGTVLGFYYTFAPFQTIEPTTANLCKLTGQVAAGMSTAIITTATGLACRLLLELILEKVLRYEG